MLAQPYFQVFKINKKRYNDYISQNLFQCKTHKILLKKTTNDF